MNVQPPIVVLAENDRAVVLDVPKKAVPVGTVGAVQLALASKSKVPTVGPATVAELFQVASCAAAAPASPSVGASATVSSAQRRSGSNARRAVRTDSDAT